MIESKLPDEITERIVKTLHTWSGDPKINDFKRKLKLDHSELTQRQLPFLTMHNVAEFHKETNHNYIKKLFNLNEVVKAGSFSNWLQLHDTKEKDNNEKLQLETQNLKLQIEQAHETIKKLKGEKYYFIFTTTIAVLTLIVMFLAENREWVWQKTIEFFQSNIKK